MEEIYMVEPIFLDENEPFPNNPLPVLYYENVLESVFGEDFSGDDVLELFKNNGFVNGWTGGILDRHHFHSNAHEALACSAGELRVQLGGPQGRMFTIRKGDVLLLPAGTAHKKLEATEEHEIIGAYPLNDSEYDMQYGDADNYEAIKESIANVAMPHTDPVTGSPSHIEEYWNN